MASSQMTFHNPHETDSGSGRSSSKPANRPSRCAVKSSQAVFLALSIILKVPIVSHDQNTSFGSDHIVAGRGASFLVSRSYESIQDSGSAPGEVKDGNLFLPPVTAEAGAKGGFIVKKVRTQNPDQRSERISDASQLAAITNELRILGHSKLRTSEYIVKLFHVTWDEMPNSGRHWPRLILEAADHGDLKAYMASQSLPLSWETKQALILDISLGLAALHGHHVTHCDLKLQNTLVFARPGTPPGSGQLRAKLCDFGFSVILQDYDTTSVFERILGTPPWNAPELTIPIPLPVVELPSADIYNFALVLSQVVLDGANPFGSLTVSEIEELKRKDTKDELLVYTVVKDAVTGAFASHPQDGKIIDHVLRSALTPERKQRPSAYEIVLLISSLSSIDVAQAVAAEAASESSERDDLQADIEDTTFLSGSGTELDWEMLPPPLLIPKTAQQEVFQDLANQAKGFTSSSLSYESVCYALALSYLQGYGTDPDQESGLEWLQKAADGGHKRAILVIDNVYRALEATPPEGSQERFVQIQEIAKKELIEAKLPSSGAFISHWAFLATKIWVGKDVSRYVEYIKSKEFKVARACHWLEDELRKTPLSSWTCEMDFATTFKQYGWSDQDLWLLKLIEGFAQEVKRVRCDNKIGASGLTMLQSAALFGHLELAKTLLEETNVDVEATGVVGLTPLWISCSLGHTDVAIVLLEHGASASTREPTTGRSILHLLSQLPAGHLLYRIIEAALDSGIPINDRDFSGNEPLSSSNLSWDFSLGDSMRQIMLRRPVSFADLDTKSTFAMAARDLDVQTIKLLSECAEFSPQDDVVSGIFLTATKIQTFAALIQCSKFYRMCIKGDEARKSLMETVALLLHRTRLELTSQPFTESKPLMENMFPGIPFDLKPLPFASSHGHDDVVEAIIDSKSNIDIDQADLQGNTALSWAIERRNRAAFYKLLQARADPTLWDKKNNTTISVAARAWPSFVPEVVAVWDERFKSAQKANYRLIAQGVLQDYGIRVGISRETILMRNADSFAPHELALLEGTPEHMGVVVWLTKKFSLNWDTQSHSIAFSTPSAMFRSTQVSCTVLATLIRFATSSKSNLLLEAPINYLLQRKPTPSFVCCRTGTTLLMLAMGGWDTADRNSKFIGDTVLLSILNAFPDAGHFDIMDDNGMTALHAGAYNLNSKALQILDAFLVEKKITINVDVVDPNGDTALDAVQSLLHRASRENYEVSLERLATGDTPEQKIERREDAAHKTVQVLRKLGCHYSAELEGILLLFLACPRSRLRPEGLKTFLQKTNDLHEVSCMQEPVFITTERDASLEPGWMLRLCWINDGFVLHASSAAFCAVDDYRQGVLESNGSRSFGGTQVPWTTDHYEEVFLNRKVEWNRKGRIWSQTEVETMVEEISQSWKEATQELGTAFNILEEY